jgi:methionine-rich copper-binding protein CopC
MNLTARSIQVRNHTFVLSREAVAIALFHDKTPAEAAVLTDIPAEVLDRKCDGMVRMSLATGVTFAEMADAILHPRVWAS